jgi:type IV pilus assembly protein PilA
MIMKNRKDKGFSLIELLIVVAIILIIAAIAIPNLLRAKIAANQASAVGSLRTISSAEETFSSTYNDGFTPTLAQLGGPAGGAAACANAELIDEVLTGGTKSGYLFAMDAGDGVAISTAAYTGPCAGWGLTGFNASAAAQSLNTGTASYCIDESGVVRVNAQGGVTAPTSPCSTSAQPPL